MVQKNSKRKISSQIYILGKITSKAASTRVRMEPPQLWKKLPFEDLNQSMRNSWKNLSDNQDSLQKFFLIGPLMTGLINLIVQDYLKVSYPQNLFPVFLMKESTQLRYHISSTNCLHFTILCLMCSIRWCKFLLREALWKYYNSASISCFTL